MWINNLKIALRGFLRRKYYTFINIAGLSIGLAASLLIILYISDEINYDSFHRDADRIFRVQTRAKMAGKEMNTIYSSAPIAADLKNDIPEVRAGCRIALWNNVNLQYQDRYFTEKKVLLADSNFFDFFDFRLLYGNPGTALKEMNSIVLTEKTAKKFFGNDAGDFNQFIGRMITVGANENYRITGIAENPPSNSHLKYDLIFSMESWDYSHSTSWLGNRLHNYIKLEEHADYHEVEKKFPALVEKYIGPKIEQGLGISLDQFYAQGGMYGYYLQPLPDIHLHPQTQGELEPPGNIKMIYILSAIAVLILLTACINFMNLSSARYMDRVKEIGIKKSLGATRGRLFRQFIIESIILTTLSMLFAILMVWAVMPAINIFSDKLLHISMLITPSFLGGIIMIIMLVGILSGSYPAIYLTSFSPIDILRHKIKANNGNNGFRNYFVAFQFTISMVLVIGTLLVYKQLRHLQNKDLGFDKENVVILNNTEALGKDKSAFKEELRKMNGIINVSITSHAPPEYNYSTVFKSLGENSGDFPSTYCVVDENNFSAMGLEMVAGRFFSKAFISDSSSVVVNETAVKLLGWENPIGRKIETGFRQGKTDIREVIGVVRDFHFQSLRYEMSSLFMFYGTGGNKMIIRLAPGNVGEGIRIIDSKWKKYAAGHPLEYSFIDSDFNAKFRKEHQTGSIISIFSGLAIFIACLGLLGLATFTAELRSKEIGIRKVMGASVPGILQLLSLNYLKLIGVSFLLAIPVSYYLNTWWLNNFAYKAKPGFLVFLAGGAVTALVALVSVSLQSLKAACRNPVDTLKTE